MVYKPSCKAGDWQLYNDRTLLMTQTKWFWNIYGIRQSYLLIVIWNCIKTNALCPAGTFKSDFLSGGCALCPQKLKYCENEELEDSVRCFKACRRIFSTPPAALVPTPSPQLRKSSTSPTRTTTQAPVIRKTITTKTVSDRVSNSPHYVIFKDALTISTSSYSSDKQSGYSTDIIFGIAVTVLALILVLGICFALWWKGGRISRNISEQRNSVFYGPVRRHSRPNSDQNINGETSENTGEVVNVEDIGSSFSMRMPSVSHEDFENMPEADV